MSIDVSKPRHPITSLRLFAAEIFTVTVGILIALGLQAAVEAANHRHTARQARESFRTELQETRRQVQRNLDGFHATEGDFKIALGYLQGRLEHRADLPPLRSMNFVTNFTPLSTAAWDTALATQAFSYMSPAETRALAEVHSDQEAFATLGGLAVQAGTAVTGIVGDPATYDDAQLRATYAAVAANYAYLQAIAALDAAMLADIDSAQKVLRA